MAQLQQCALQTHHNHHHTPLPKGAAASKQVSATTLPSMRMAVAGLPPLQHFTPAKPSDAMHTPRAPRLNRSSQLCQGRAVA